MSKPNIRSFRYSDRVAEILINQPGDSLNEKFENLVIYCFDRVPWVEQRLETLEQQIEYKRKVMHDMEKTFEQINMMNQELSNMKIDLQRAARRAKAVADNDL